MTETKLTQEQILVNIKKAQRIKEKKENKFKYTITVNFDGTKTWSC